MLKLIRLLILISFSFSFTQSLSAKSIVVLLDNSASMKIQEGEEFSQCDASIFSIQLILSTKDENDDVYVIPAYRSDEEVQILKNPSIDEIRDLTCYNASIFKSLKEALRQVEIIEDEDKKMILVGDGEWFTESDSLTQKLKDSLIDDFSKSSETTDIWYLNTSKNNNPKNQFKNIISEVDASYSNVDVLETNNNPEKLLSTFDLVTKSMLKIPDTKQEYEINDNRIVFNTQIPTKELFVLVQSFKSPYKGKLTAVSSSSENSIKLNKNASIQKGDIYGGLYSVKNDKKLIKPGEISFIFNEPIPKDARVSVYYIPGITLQKPTFSGNSNSILSSNGNTYRVCDSLTVFPLEYKLKDSYNNDVLVDYIQVQILDKNGRVLQNAHKNNSVYNATIPLESSLKNEEFIFSVRIGDAYEDKIPILITKSKCIEMGILSKTFKYSHYLPSDSLFIKQINIPTIFDVDTKKPIKEEQYYLEYKIDGDTTLYNVSIHDKINIIESKEGCNLLCSCMRIAGKKTIYIEITHPNVKEKAVYTINIQQEDLPFYSRCWKLLVALALLLLLLIYLYLLRKKKKFYRKGKMRAKILKYDNNLAPRDQYIKGTFMNRLNPFISEKDKTYGFDVKATASQKILISVNSIERKARGRKVLIVDKNDYGFEWRKKENKKYETLSKGNGIEFRDGRSLEKYKYDISRKK